MMTLKKAWRRQPAWPAAAALMVLLTIAPLSPADAGSETIVVAIDKAKLLKLPTRVATIVVGNPLIADVALQSGGIIVLTGKGYGITNIVALDRAGNTLLEKSVLVQGPREDLVVVYRGMERESYSCAPICERRITLGDAQPYFDAVLGQTGSRNGQAVNGNAPK
jgi:Flp pilus assembly secretin CpaC